MEEWTVLMVLVTLVGLGAAIIKPMLALNATITKLAVAVDSLQKDTDELVRKNGDSHARMWEHNKDQDVRLDNHEGRIVRLESSKGEQA